LLDGNAVHEAVDRIAALVEPAFCINSIVNQDGKVAAVYAGHWRGAHRRACEDYLLDHSIPIHEKRDLVIVSAGGWPYDINLIQAHKALEMASHACTDGGTIIWLAECPEGLGRPDFLQWFAESDSRALAERLRIEYEVNGQTAWSLMQKLERFQIALISSMSGELIRIGRLATPKRLDEFVVANSRAGSGFVIPGGAKTLPLLTSANTGFY
jgi:nickel-dependent lactate racemase